MTNLTGYPDTQVMMFTCQNCKTIERIEYIAQIEEDETQTCGQIFTGWYRLESGEKVYWNSDSQCPTCRRSRKTGNLKVTVKTTHICDDTCKNAKSDKCVCSCGGKNHGIKYERYSQKLSLFA